MIKIGAISKTVANGQAKISASITVGATISELWYSVSENYSFALCESRSDAFVAGLLLYAIRRREDISFETPITDELKESIEEDFLLAVCDYNKDVYSPKLIGPVSSAIHKEGVVRGTGISCGVDSLYTVIRRMVKQKNTDIRNYLAIFNHHGVVGVPGEESKHERQARFEAIVDRARRFSEAVEIPLIVGDTNYNSGDIPGLISEGNATFVNMFCALSMQNLFTHYMIASAGGVGEFGYYLNQGFHNTIHENFDILTTSAFSTASMRITVDGLVTRDEKVRYLADEVLAQKFLDVCHVHQLGNEKNGTNDCAKCMRTVLELMLLGDGVLERFSDVFDIEYVKTHRYEYLAEMMRGMLHKSLFAQQCWRGRSKMGFTYLDYCKAIMIVVRKVWKKILRRGKTGYCFSADGRC